MILGAIFDGYDDILHRGSLIIKNTLNNILSKVQFCTTVYLILLYNIMYNIVYKIFGYNCVVYLVTLFKTAGFS